MKSKDLPQKRPTKAVSVRYDHGVDKAPKVIARGQGILAEEILRVAQEHQVPIKQDSGLVDCLLKLDYMQEIPEELYYIVAEILVFAYEQLGKPVK